MGVDYVPFVLKPNVSEEDISSWITIQADSFRSMPYYWATGKEWECAAALSEMLVGIHKQRCHFSSDKLREVMEFPDGASYRVAAVITNSSLPINVRINSLSTIAPSKLSQYVDIWEANHVTALQGPWVGRTESWAGQMEWMTKFLAWVKQYQDKNYGLYLCW